MTQPSIIFSATGTFAALDAAQRFLASAGFSCAPGCAGQHTGIMFGDYRVAKWKNLSRADRDGLHAIMTGYRREGPLTIRLTDKCPPEGTKAFLDAASELEGIA